MSKIPAVLSYPDSNNLGDFIQSLAAKQCLKGEEILFLDRDQLHQYSEKKASLLMNGWFMEIPENWPPSEGISPLFISFHLNPTAKKAMLSAAGIAYFKKHQPIGCRDYYTQKLLTNVGIESYYSACLTLSLNRSDFVSKSKKREGIYVISPMERLNPDHQSKTKGNVRRVLTQLKKTIRLKKYKRARNRLESFLEKQREPVFFSSQLCDPTKHSEQDRIELARKQLEKIASAKLVITSRIHTALPAVAFGTPILFLSDGLDHPNQKSRLEGMEQFFPILNSKDLWKWESELPKPSTNHLPFVKKFKKEISRFLKE